MTVKEIIKLVALMQGRENVLEYLDGQNALASEELLKIVNALTGLTNLVINELACTYIPMVKVERVSVDGGRIYYKDLKERPLKIVALYGVNGNSLEYTQNAEYITVSAAEVEVEYHYAPANYGLEEVIGYTEMNVPARVIAYGVLSELCISEGRFDEAVTWHKRYIDALSDICLPKNAVIRKRRWG